MKIRIGSIEIENNVFLAPMAGITDRSFRYLCRVQGAGLSYTEMISAKGLFYNSKNTQALLDAFPEERPLGVQLFGSDAHILADMAEIIATGPVDLIDINMGCPASKIVKNREGSALMKEPDKVARIVSAVSRRVRIPVTVKIRKGYDENSVNAVEIARIIEDSGAAAITIHGRTKEQYYGGQADWDIIAKVKAAVKIPVIGNGDVTDPHSARNMLQKTGCDGVMVARAAEGNPWIFSRIARYLDDGVLLPEPSDKEKIAMALRHAQMIIAHKGEYIGIREMRKHLGWYMKGMQGAAALRVQINNLKTYEELEAMLVSLG